MKYIVLSSDHQLMGFKNKSEVAQYCLVKDGQVLNDYCDEEGYTYETMTSTEIGQLYTEVGADFGGCSIYKTHEILKEMHENGVEPEMIERIKNLLTARDLKHPVRCPGYLEDVLGEMTPLSPAQMSEKLYFMDNIDSSSESTDNG